MIYLPTYVIKSVYDIDFAKLYAEGKRIILSDLDNTLASYAEKRPSLSLKELYQEIIKYGFKIYLVTNNNNNRLLEFIKEFPVTGYLIKARKPQGKRLKKFIETENLNSREIIAIGDQLLTDTIAYRKNNLDTILVKSIDRKTEHWYTKINRLREKNLLKRIKKENQEIYQKIKELYE